jgi:UDP-N-acetylmuramate dehydrogenase
MVSEKHAVFIINYDYATSRDVVIDVIVRETVFRKFGVELSAEVKLIGRNYSER